MLIPFFMRLSKFIILFRLIVITFLLSISNNQFPSPCISIASTSMELLEYVENTFCTVKIKYKMSCCSN